MASSFSGKSGRQTAMWTASQLNDQLAGLHDVYGKGRVQADAAVKSGYGKSLADLKKYYPQSRNDLTQGMAGANQTIATGRDQSIEALQGGYGQAIDAAGQYYGQGADALQQGVQAFQPLVDEGMKGYNMYSNSMGLNGAEGNAAATGAFQAGPGYQWQVDQAQQGAARAANKIGGAYGGNATDAATRLSSNLANQEYGNWQKGLQGYQGAAQQAVSGQAGQLANLASLYGNQATTTSNLYANQGKDMSGVYTGAATGQAANQMATGKGLSDLASGQGANLATLDTGYGQSVANNALSYMGNEAGALNNYYTGLIPAGQQGMQAGQQAAANRMGAMMGGLQMVAGVAGMGTGGGGTIGGSLFKSAFGGK